MKDQNKAKLIKNVLINTLKGGFGIVLPTFGMLLIINFVYNFILKLLSPLTDFLSKFLHFPLWLVDLFSLSLIVFVCFFCGVMLQTKLGKVTYFLYELTLKKLKIFKLFNALQEIYNLFFSKGEKAFSEAVLAFPYGRRHAGWSGLVSSRWTYKGTNYISVFFPTCPNFSSGIVKHIPEKDVDVLSEVPVEQMMKTVIACGAGTKDLFERYNVIRSEQNDTCSIKKTKNEEFWNYKEFKIKDYVTEE